MVIHTVKRGETLSGIARMYGTSVSRIISDNGLFDLPYPVVGQALIILIPERVYTVNQGDTIFSVSQRFNISQIELLQKNPTLITNPTLYIGQTLTITFRDEGDTPLYISGYVYPYVSERIFRRSLPYISDCAVFGYGFRDDGSLIPPDDDTALIDIIYSYDASPHLLLSSITDDGGFSTERSSLLFNNLTLQQTVIENTVSVMREKGYRGIDIDFEYINPNDTDAFVEFVRNCTDAMHQNGFMVNVDLAPKTSANQQGLLYEAHDYRSLGEIADTVLLMTYEWGYTYGPPMPVAPIQSVRRVVEYAVTEIPRDKIMMGIPNYGYDWKLPYERGTTVATNLGNQGAVSLAAREGAEIMFDSRQASPFFEYTDNMGNAHIVWFEDVRSIKSKYDLIREFNLRGAGYWNLMRYFDQNWAYVSHQFNVNKN